ncbi:DNA-deoxyinosine glycosylase [bacterium]|nr:DNA-deoxyinosine glycosylase [bacterium]
MALRQIHNIAPVYDGSSRVLILGSFPSVLSRQSAFFYGHPRNRFWQVAAALTGWPHTPQTAEEKKEMLLSGGVAVWDVIASCSICGSSDSSIKEVVPNDISPILRSADIKLIACNGGKSYELYCRYLRESAGREAIKLPSTSPANAAYSLERLINEWRGALGGVLKS